ncbi:hypothetical protein CVT24_000737 [Panaeolus cyanescens]|uniref:Uncharacterized protein n=1 Tax=Panaeolus cyanescens TaxID=181874 RepID=A0A409YCS3_9AGAR|nr:hypothetical protein CVT24_000737 [Panaeolus cyanescens]
MIMVVQPGQVPHSFPVPDTAFSGGSGKHSFPLPYRQDDQVIFMLSDATSLNAGGPSRPFIVGNRRRAADPACPQPPPTPDFTFTGPTELSQCQLANFSDFSGAEQPVTITGIVSRRQLFRLSPPAGSTTFSWPTQIDAFEDVVFGMTDAKGRTSAMSSLIDVQPGGDMSCFGPVRPPPTNPNDAKKPAQRNMGVIGGSIAAAIFGLLLIAFVIWMVRRHKRKQRAIQAGMDLSPPRAEDMEMKRKSLAVENGDGHLVEMYVSTMKRSLAAKKAAKDAERAETRANLARLQRRGSAASSEDEGGKKGTREDAMAALTAREAGPATEPEIQSDTRKGKP